VDEGAIAQVVDEAVRIARAGAAARREPVELTPEQVVSHGRYATPVRRDPFEVKLEDKIAYLLDADRQMRAGGEAGASGPKGVGAAIRSTNSSLEFLREEKVFASSEGAYIEQTLTESGGSLAATAVGGGDAQVRSYPNGRAGGHRTGGFEVVDDFAFVDHAERVGREAIELVNADQCPSFQGSLIITGTQLGLQIHESVGHPTELDRVLGSEVSMAGASFLTTDNLDRLTYASPIVNLVADATVPGGMGTFGFDDEGVAAQRTDLVREGRFVGYLSSRDTAGKIGRTSSGAARATGPNKIPLVRMTNINLEPGDWTLDEIIRDTKYGLLVDGTKAGSIDDMRVNFQFGPEAAWEIVDGSLSRMVKNPVYTGRSLDFWRSCDAIAGRDRDEWAMWGTPTCGKGQPGQVARVGHGAAPARFANVKVGVGRW